MNLSRKNTAIAKALILSALAGLWFYIEKAPQNWDHKLNPTPSASPTRNLAGGKPADLNVAASNSNAPLTAKLEPAEVSPGALPEQEIKALKRKNFEAYLRYQKRLSHGATPQVNSDIATRKIDAEGRIKARLAVQFDPKTHS